MKFKTTKYLRIEQKRIIIFVFQFSISEWYRMTRHKWPSQLFFKQLEIVYNCVARQVLYNNTKTSIKRKYFWDLWWSTKNNKNSQMFVIEFSSPPPNGGIIWMKTFPPHLIKKHSPGVARCVRFGNKQIYLHAIHNFYQIFNKRFTCVSEANFHFSCYRKQKNSKAITEQFF